jgi:hypothetical protein
MRRVQFQLSHPPFMRRVLSFSLILYLCVLVAKSGSGFVVVEINLASA